MPQTNHRTWISAFSLSLLLGTNTTVVVLQMMDRANLVGVLSTVTGNI